MEINDFSTLLQLSATLNIAFVAVEYAKTYTHTLSEKVFKFQDFIVDSFRRCHELLLDRETLDHMEPVDVGGKSTNNKIEKAKRDYEILSKEINTEEERLKESVKIMCESKSMSSLSLWLFLYSTTALFLCGVEKNYPLLVQYLWSSISAFSIIFLLVGWGIGEKDWGRKCIDFTSLRHGIILYSISSFISILVAIFVNIFYPDYVIPYWSYILVLTALLPYTNFIMFFIKIKGKAKSIKHEIETSAGKSETKCGSLKVTISDLLSVNKINKQLAVDE